MKMFLNLHSRIISKCSGFFYFLKIDAIFVLLSNNNTVQSGYIYIYIYMSHTIHLFLFHLFGGSDILTFLSSPGDVNISILDWIIQLKFKQISLNCKTNYSPKYLHFNIHSSPIYFYVHIVGKWHLIKYPYLFCFLPSTQVRGEKPLGGKIPRWKTSQYPTFF